MLLKISLLIGILSLIFAVWTIYGLTQRKHRKSLPPLKKKWFLGVCADFSQYVGMPLWVVRLYAILYSPFIVGILFYFLYYLVIKVHPSPPVITPSKRPVKITKMESHHY